MTIPSARSPVGSEHLQTEETYAELFEGAPCGYLTTTSDGIITRINGTFERWTGYAREALIGTPFPELLGASGTLFYETRYAMVLRLAGEVREVALSLRRADGSELPVLVNAVLVTDSEGEPAGIRTAVFDATERQDYERQLVLARRAAEASEARVRVLQDASRAFGLATTAQELIGALAESARTAMQAVGAAVLLAGETGELEPAAGDERALALCTTGLRELAEQAIESGDLVTISNLDQAAAIIPGLDAALHRERLAALSVAPFRGDSLSGVVVCLFGRDRSFDDETRNLQAALARQAAQVLRRVRLQEELEHRALHDQLTGLANRKLLQERLEAGLAAAARSRRPLSVVFVDLDGFKTINDELGHRVGDEVLAEVATRLRRVARAGDPVARYGGDEFVVVCEDAGSDAGTVIAERLRLEVRRPLASIPPAYTIAASIGLATWKPAGAAPPSTATILRAADEAMYQSKHAGRDRVTAVTV